MYSVAERFITLATNHGRKLTVIGPRTVRVQCETEDDLRSATVAMFNAAAILRVRAKATDVSDLAFTVELT